MNRLYPLNMDSVLTESLLKQSPKEILHTMIQHMRGQLQVGCFLARGAVYAVGYHQGVEWVMWVTAQESELVIKDLLTRSFCVLRSQLDGALETLSVEGLQHDAILDLDADGTRWEGDGRDGVPFGFGVLYNAHNDKEYEGFRIGDDSWGYGVEFGEDTRAVQFTGWTLKGVKFGQGVVFDRGGKPTSIYFENDLPTDETKLLTNTVNSIALSSEWQLTEFNPPMMWRLQTLTIDAIHLNPKAVFTIRNQPALTTLFIHFPQRSLSPPSPVIADCPLLQRIEFADYAFPSYPFPTLSNLPSLSAILFGRCCFSSPSVCSFIGLSSLTSLVFRNGALYGCNEAIFQGMKWTLPLIQTSQC